MAIIDAWLQQEKWILGLSRGEREAQRNKFKREIETLVLFDGRSQKRSHERRQLREELYESLESKWYIGKDRDGEKIWIDLYCEIIYLHILTYLRDPFFAGKTRDEVREEKSQARKFYRSKLIEGRTPRTPEPSKDWVPIVAFDKKGRPFIKLLGDDFHRPKNITQKLLIVGAFIWIAGRVRLWVFDKIEDNAIWNEAAAPSLKEEVLKMIQNILYAFCDVKIKTSAIERDLARDRILLPFDTPL